MARRHAKLFPSVTKGWRFVKTHPEIEPGRGPDQASLEDETAEPGPTAADDDPQAGHAVAAADRRDKLVTSGCLVHATACRT